MNKKRFLLLQLVILPLSGAFFLYHAFLANPANKVSADNNTLTETNAPVPVVLEPEKKKKSSPSNHIELSKLSVPIFMYHHIQDTDSKTNPIERGLSVSPQKFANQLDYIQSKGYRTVTFKELENGATPEKPVILTFDDGYHNFYENAFPELKKRNMTGVIFIISGKNSSEYLTGNEIKTIQKYGIEIGSHTINHFDLTSLSNDTARKEIAESKSRLEKEFNTDIISFCYPAGEYNDQIVKLAKSAGYDFAVTTKSGQGKFSDPFELKRYRITEETYISAYIK